MEFEQLVCQLNAADEQSQINAAEQIAKLDNPAPYAVSLIRALATRNEDLCQWATAALESVKTPETNDLPEFVNILNDYLSDASNHPDSAFWAATMIGMLGQRATSAVAKLDEAALSAPDRHVQKRAKWALNHISDAA